MNTDQMRQQIHRLQPLPKTDCTEPAPTGMVQRPTATFPLYGSPCAGCSQPAREMHLYQGDRRVVVHVVGDRQEPCRITGLAGGAA